MFNVCNVFMFQSCFLVFTFAQLHLFHTQESPGRNVQQPVAGNVSILSLNARQLYLLLYWLALTLYAFFKPFDVHNNYITCLASLRNP